MGHIHKATYRFIPPRARLSTISLALGLPVCKKDLLCGRKEKNRTYFGLSGTLPWGRQCASRASFRAVLSPTLGVKDVNKACAGVFGASGLMSKHDARAFQRTWGLSIPSAL